MDQKTLDRLKEQLIEMRDRLTAEVDRMVEAAPNEMGSSGNLSHVPTHLADLATDGIDKEMSLIQNEQLLRSSVLAALARFDDGSYGKCLTCGREISEGRLRAIPYAARCIECAQRSPES